MTYSEKLKDPRWQRKRLEIMARDEFACRFCFDEEETLNVHHCYYGKGRDPWDYDDEHLITVCRTCHEDIEIKREEILKTLSWEVPLYAIHKLATLASPFFLAQVSLAFSQETPRGGRGREESIRAAISFLESRIDPPEFKNPKSNPDNLDLDEIIDLAISTESKNTDK